MLAAGGTFTVGAEDGAALRLRAPAAVIGRTTSPGDEGVLTPHELSVVAHVGVADGHGHLAVRDGSDEHLGMPHP
jgi:hypothetical protein